MATHNKTLISAFQPFATGADLVLYRDWRHLADLLLDDDTRVTTSGGVISHPTVTLALRTASANIETAIYRGGRYTRDDVAAILDQVTATDPTTGIVTTGYTVARDILREMTCDLAFWTLVKRRKPDANPRSVSGVLEAYAKMSALELGEAVFPFLENQDATLMDIASLDPNRSKAQVNSTPMSSIASRMFGTRTRYMWNL